MSKSTPTRRGWKNLTGLEDGWYGPKSVAPTPAVLELAQKIERSLFFAPRTDGGVQVEFHCGGIDLEIEFDADAEMESVFVGKADPS